jgi:hypothetical protein
LTRPLQRSPPRASAAAFFSALLLTAASIHAAEIELTPQVGGVLGGAVATRQGDLELDPSAALGLTVGWHVRHDGLIEFTYSRQETALDLDSRPLFDVTLDYLQAGGAWEIQTGRVRPFIGIGLGASRLDPDSDRFDEEWLFSAGMYGGVKRYFGERVGLRVEGRGLLHLTGGSGGFFCGFSGGASGCAVTLSGDGFLQLQAQVGLIVRL